MTVTLAFDVYGTLIDTHGMIDRLALYVGDRATAFSQHWRERQLEYSFRRGLMRQYQDFTVCTEQALQHTSDVFAVSLTAAQRADLMAGYLRLPAFADVSSSLAQLAAEGCSMHAFSNGSAAAVNQLLTTAQLRTFFTSVVSADEVQTFKPDPAFYQHFLSVTGASIELTWLISSNPFDVIGALAVGMKAAWVQRSDAAVFDPWEIPPTYTIRHLGQLRDAIAECTNTA